MKIEYILIKKSDDFYSSVEQFKNLLMTNSRISVEEESIIVSDNRYSYNLSTQEVKWGKRKDRIFNFTVSTDNNAERDAANIEIFDRLLRRIINESGDQFIINTIWDDASIYYANRLYPKITGIENLLRKIIYKFMVSIAGGSWFDDTVPDDVKKKIVEVQKKDEAGTVVKSYSSDQLYDADFIQLDNFFFRTYPLKPVSQETITRIKALITENTDKEKLIKNLSDYEYKSNWDRYFADKINIDDFSEKWTRLYQLRNKVAHTKRLKKQEYEEAIGLIKELEIAFNACLNEIDNISVSEEETIAAKESVRETIGSSNPYSSFLKAIAEVYRDTDKWDEIEKLMEIMNTRVSDIPDKEKSLGEAWIEAQRNAGALNIPVSSISKFYSTED